MIRSLKYLFRFGVFTTAVLIIIIAFCNQLVEYKAAGKVYTAVEDVPYNKVGLVPGTSHRLRDGSPNMYFQHRIDAATALYKAGKIDFILVSGDNRHSTYNEPKMMKAYLAKQGVPDSVIYLDYAGFRTLDSVVRCKEVFGQDSVTVISQAFHNKRAIFIARKFGLHAIGYNAATVSKYAGIKTLSREYLARVKAVLDVYVLAKGPKFLGDKIIIK